MPVAASIPLEIEAGNADALFDGKAEPTYPHTSRLLNPKLAAYLEGLARAQPRSASLEIHVTLRAPALASGDEDRVQRQVRTFFVEEERLAQVDIRVNRTEAVGFLPLGLPLVLVALLAAGVLYLGEPWAGSPSLRALLAALLYLLFISVVWVILWDPIEKILFDGYLLRRRALALRRLGAAPIRFTYGPPPPA